MPFARFLFPFLFLSMLFSTGCASRAAVVTGKVVVTPVVVVRDVVDVPLVSLSSLFNYWGDLSNPLEPPQPGVSWSWRGGFDFGITYGLGFFVFKTLTGVIGGVDYVICRSIYPAFPVGLRPWRKEGQPWGDLYFPNTRALWSGNPPRTVWSEPPAGSARMGPADPLAVLPIPLISPLPAWLAAPETSPPAATSAAPLP